LVSEYLKKAEIKEKAGSSVRRNVRLADLPDDYDHEVFVTHGAIDSSHLLARCRTCNRVGIVRLMYPRSESFRPMAQRILSSYRDHGEGGVTPWALYGFRFGVPNRYVLYRHSLHAGRMEMEFRAGKCRAVAVRLGLAETLLKRTKLIDWLRQDLVGQFPHAKVNYAEIERAGQWCVEATGVERFGWRRFFGKGIPVRLLAWHCPEQNAILIARWKGPESHLPDFDAFTTSFVCPG
jgi:hypothetical protein